jgi:hypothetical protein
MTIKHRIVFISAAATALSAISYVALAITVPETYTPLAPLPDVTSQNLSLATTIDFSTYVRYFYNLLIALGAVAAVLMITWGGFEYMTSDAAPGKTDGIAKVRNAIYGLLMILSSWLILRTIDPRFVNISSTIVPPLNIAVGNNVGDSLTTWQQSMDAISAQFQNQADSAIAAKNAAKAKVDDLQKQFDAANAAAQDACQNGSQGACDEAINNANVLQDQLNTAKSALATASSYANMTGILNTVYSGGEVVNGANGSSTNTFLQSSPEVLDKAQTALNSTANNAIAGVNASGGDPQAIQLIQQERNIGLEQIGIAKTYNQIAAGTLTVDQAISNIQSSQDWVKSHITDPSLKSNVDAFNTEATQTIKKIKDEQAAENEMNSSSAAY